MLINPDVKSLYDFTHEDFTLVNYEPQAHIKAPIAV
jgi:thymidylate synthase